MVKYQTTGGYFKNDLYLHKDEPIQQIDYVQKNWEDELMQFVWKPFIKKLAQFKKKNHKKLRILELGSGIGKGFELLTKITTPESRLKAAPEYILEEDLIDLYLGLDLTYENVEGANDLYRDKKRVRFIRHDFRQGLGLFKEAEAGFDIYWVSAEAVTGLSNKETLFVLKELIEHAPDGALLMFDLRGKNWLLNPFAFGQAHATGWSKTELEILLTELETKTYTQLTPLKRTDRSILIGESDDARQYGNQCKTIRKMIHSLFDASLRTDLHKLLLKPETISESIDAETDAFLEELHQSWNLFIQYAMHRFEHETAPEHIKGWENFSATLKFGLLTLHRLVKDTEWIAYGDVRASILEPHIGYVLRSLEHEQQRGLGCGQYLNVLIQVNK
jgi:hypothetical protein